MFVGIKKANKAIVLWIEAKTKHSHTSYFVECLKKTILEINLRAFKGFCLIIFIFTSPNISAGQIALTFDDAPLPGSALIDGDEKTTKIIAALKSRKVKDALFFITTRNIVNAEAVSRLKRYTDEGFHLANHSHAHRSAQKIEVQDYLADLFTSDLISRNFDNLLKFHRPPFLHQGADEQSRQQIYQGLIGLGYEFGYVTVDNFDWYINSKTLNAHKEGKVIDFDRLKSLYIDVLWSSIVFYDEIARMTLGRSPKHVLLLHENEMTALFLGDLIDHIRSNGWEIISPQEAYTDPISRGYSPSLQFSNQGRVAAIAHSKGMEEDKLRHPSENTEYLDKAFEQYGVFK